MELMVKSETQLLTEIQLRKLTTPRLLSYLQSLNTCHDTKHYDNYRPNELVKSSQIWQEQHVLVKSVLAERPHVSKTR